VDHKPRPSHPARHRVLLAVTAHPDDESFGMGGTLALYAREEFLKGYQSIAEMRVAELECAARILGLTEVHMLDYRDSGMANSPDNSHPNALAAQPVKAVANRIIDLIRMLKPQVVVTFDPIGGYYHPDHIAIHRATVEAFNHAADPAWCTGPAWQPDKLYFHTMPHGYLRAAVKILPLFGKDPRKFGSNGDIDLTAIAAARFPTHAVIDTRTVRQLQDAAAACHASQGGREMSHGLRAWLSRLFSSRDTFMRDTPKPVPGELVEKDLFSGL
jgi:N-acetyl-1-D-myo-inositol-2-amino-2-deoxy-alpha-D-glucopyranoside deacetylase